MFNNKIKKSCKQGGHSVVYKIRNKENNNIYAAKRFKISGVEKFQSVNFIIV